MCQLDKNPSIGLYAEKQFIAKICDHCFSRFFDANNFHFSEMIVPTDRESHDSNHLEKKALTSVSGKSHAL